MLLVCNRLDGSEIEFTIPEGEYIVPFLDSRLADEDEELVAFDGTTRISELAKANVEKLHVSVVLRKGLSPYERRSALKRLKDGERLSQQNKRARCDASVVIAAAKLDAGAIAESVLQHDEAFLKRLLRRVPTSLSHLSDGFRSNHVLSKIAIASNGAALAMTPLRDDSDFVWKLVLKRPNLLMHLGQLRECPIFNIKVLKKRPYALQFVSTTLKSNVTFAAAAVGAGCDPLLMAQSCWSDEDFVFFSIKNSISCPYDPKCVTSRWDSAFHYVHQTGPANAFGGGLRHHTNLWAKVDASLRRNDSFMKRVAKVSATALLHCNEHLRDDKEMVLRCVRNDPSMLKYASKRVAEVLETHTDYISKKAKTLV